MSTTGLHSGRTKQKLRTRREILEAARRLTAQGIVPTLEAVAEEAGISRATIYRYFSTIDLLLIEAPLDEKTASPEALLSGESFPAAASAADRAAQVQRYLHDLVARDETHFRMFLRASMDQWLRSEGKNSEPQRGARRIAMFERALEPVRDRMTKRAYRRLVSALSCMVSVEAFIAVKDVCRLNPDEGREILSWAVRTLTEAAVRESQAR